MTTAAEKSISSELGKLQIGPGPPCIIAEKPAPGTRSVQNFKVTANLFPLTLPTDTLLHKYDVCVELEFRNRVKEISKGGAADDYHKTQNRRRCFEAVWKTLVHSRKEFFGDPFAVLYNRWNAIYTVKKLDLETQKKFDVKFVDPESGKEERCTVSLEVGDPERVCLTDFSQEISRNLVDRASCPTTKALEDLISQPIFLKDEYFSFYRNFYKMPANPVPLGGGRVMADGFSEALKIMGDPAQPQAAVQIDPKFTAFHKEQLVIETVKEEVGLRDVPLSLTPQQRIKVARAIRDLAVRTTHTQNDFKIASVSHETARTYTISDLEHTVEEHFMKVYSLKLRYPDLPCVKQLASRPGDSVIRYNYYPMEVCRILPNQRVAVKKQTTEQQQKMIKEAAKPPLERLKMIKTIAGMASDNKSLETLGGKMGKEPMVFRARRLPPPQIQYQEPANAVKPRDTGVWDPSRTDSRYSEQGWTKKWALLKMDNRISNDDAMKNAIGIGEFYERFFDAFETEEYQLDSRFKQLREAGVDFVVVIEPGNSIIHEKVKLAEFLYAIQTQCVACENAKAIVSPPPGRSASRWAGVLRNFTQKTNMKTRGFNYHVLTDHEAQNFLKPGTMIIGCDVTHPAAQISKANLRRGIESTEPSIVGFSFNSCSHPQQFLGEIRFQSGGTENIEEMDVLMYKALERYAVGDIQKLPHSIIYYRDGVANSQFQKVMEYEIPKIRKACTGIKSDYSPGITCIIVQKRNQVRLFPEHINPNARSADQNVPVGTVVSEGISHPTTWEFQLNAHRAPQGTVSTPKFIVLLDENRMSSDQMEALTYALCYAHQIINQPVSLPEPVFAAHEIAKRGKALWRASCASDESSSGVSGGETSEKIDWGEWNDKFSLGHSIFKDHKHNA